MKFVAAVIFLVSLGCGSSERPPPPRNTTAPDAGDPARPGSYSFEARFSKIERTSGDALATFASSGQTIRVDIELAAPRSARWIVITAPYSEPVGVPVLGARLDPPPKRLSLLLTQEMDGLRIEDMFREGEVTFADDGAPRALILRGVTRETTAAGVTRMAAMTAELAFVPDETPPDFRLVGPSLAPFYLPWEARTFRASEPIWFTTTTPAPSPFELVRLANTPLANGATRVDYGFSVRATSAPPERVSFTLPSVHDLSSTFNSDGGRNVTLETVSVPTAAGERVAFTSPAVARTWGAATITTEGCREGACLRIGPFPYRRCVGSAGGFAVILERDRFRITTRAELRQLSTAVDAVPFVTDLYRQHVQAFDAKGQFGGYIAAPEWKRSGTTLDSGWFENEWTPSAHASEAGIVVSANDLGPERSCVFPAQWEATLWVQSIEPLPAP